MQNACEMTKKPSYMSEKITLNDHHIEENDMALVWFYIKNLNYREKTHFENNFSINSSKYK